MTEYPSGYPPPGHPPPYRPYEQPAYGAAPYDTQPYGTQPYEAPYGTPPYEAPYGTPPYGHYPAGWYPGEPPGPRRLDGWSVAGFVCGILPTVVLGLAFGVVGLVRTGNPLRRGRAFAVAGVVLSLAWGAGFAALGAYADHRQPTAAPAETVYWPDLLVGDCFLQPPVTGQTSVSTVLRVSCKQLHNAVIVALVQPYNAEYPGISTVLDQTLAMCRTAVVNYLHRPLGRLRYAAFAPRQPLWEAGRKNGACVLFDPDHNFKGDIRKDR